MTRPRRSGQKLTPAERREAQGRFLLSFALNANVKLSCTQAGISRNTLYQWLEHDAEFSLRFQQAELDANDTLRAEMFRRGVEGVEEPLVSNGKLVVDEHGKPLTIRKYSDSLLMKLASARMPEFREKSSVALSVHGQVSQQRNPDLDLLTDEELETLDRIFQQAAARCTR